MDIGFIGLGVMGAPMATHLAKAGHRLTLLDLDTAAARDLAATIGGQAAATPAAVAAASEVVITMLPNGQVVQQVALGDRRPGARRAGRCAAAGHLVGRTLADRADRRAPGRARRQHGRRAGLGRGLGRAGGRAGVHGRRQRRPTWPGCARCST